ncbi:MAG: hypothetical protein AB1351_04330 [Thermoproteota archaeon]
MRLKAEEGGIYPHDCSKYGAEAIRLDASGQFGSAIVFYKRVIDCRNKSAKSQFDYKGNKIIFLRVNAYQNKVNVLARQKHQPQ